MPFDMKTELPGTLPSNCGGFRRPWARGSGVISGVTKINNIVSPCRVFLHDADGTLRGYRLTGADGAYGFIGLPPGDYRIIVEDDRQGARRSKVEHVVIAAPPSSTARTTWRIYITASSDPSSAYKGVTEIEFLDAADNILTQPIYAQQRAIGSSIVNTGNQVSYAFNRSTSDGWLSQDNTRDEYVGWRFSEPGGPDIDVRKVAIRGSWNHPEGSPRDFLIQYSTDEANWITALAVTGQTGWTGASDRRVFVLP